MCWCVCVGVCVDVLCVGVGVFGVFVQHGAYRAGVDDGAFRLLDTYYSHTVYQALTIKTHTRNTC